VRIEVLTTQWGAEDQVYVGGTHDIDKPTTGFLKLAAAAEHVGAIKITASKDERAKMSSHIETQAESEKALAKAQEAGTWHEGNLDQFIRDAKARLDGELDDQTRAYLEAGLKNAKQMQALMAAGVSYDEAAHAIVHGEAGE
jgi:hypothetical protein